ncbi:TraR/DksA C4-type zinc finger protein [Iamia majanohamensis]|uniref:TraR/DksA C4-type zinc finger protein n=1 Tax=Iamia majanohamensis TaxID=467976 RepID=A0AAE9Y3C7_9ACTN|nr:TraR/DksA C4-type zinc finger protein [Iamia majanohamensis]WCO65209.1 TraR/DksA C4-type zinc finger protein [Iamia majanohamensis]
MARTTKKAASTRGAATKAPAKKKASAEKEAPAKKASAKRKAPAKKAAGTTSKTTKTTTQKVATEKVATTKAPASKKAAGKKAPAKKKAAARSPFPKAFLDAQRQALLDERATYLGQAESLKAEADSLVVDVDPGDVQFDEESGEGDSLAIERDRDLALSNQARQAVDEIDHALAKFDLGTYGICEVSGEPIPEERLEAIPWARERVEHKIGGLGRR